MNRSSDNVFRRGLMVCATIAVGLLMSTAARAQRVAVSPQTASGAAAARAQSTITRSGSYVLSRNVVVTRAGADALLITASNVTLDMQGFTISGTSGTGNGINATGVSNLVVKNGIISGVGGAAIIGGTAASISGVTVSDNGSGITCGVGCLVNNNVIKDNLGVGLTLSDATSGYRENILQGNSSSTVGTTGQVSGGSSLGENLCNGVAC